jgi:hypothetical protein
VDKLAGTGSAVPKLRRPGRCPATVAAFTVVLAGRRPFVFATNVDAIELARLPELADQVTDEAVNGLQRAFPSIKGSYHPPSSS